MLRIGICDDVYDARLVLRSALERVLERRRTEGRFFEFSFRIAYAGNEII